MRTIRKRPVPNSLLQWWQERVAKADPSAWPCTYNALRQEPEIVRHMDQALYAEQGGICAYTGKRITLSDGANAGFHWEHVNPQHAHNSVGQTDHGCAADTDYNNILACWPAPNQKVQVEYGAIEKDGWPSPSEAHLFVHPLMPSCSSRFTFDKQGRIAPANATDQAARETINKLALHHHELEALRKSALRGLLAPLGRPISKPQKATLLRKLDAAEASLDSGGNVLLEEFCFAKQAVLRNDLM